MLISLEAFNAAFAVGHGSAINQIIAVAKRSLSSPKEAEGRQLAEALNRLIEHLETMENAAREEAQQCCLTTEDLEVPDKFEVN